jgi:hypothetical protein
MVVHQDKKTPAKMVNKYISDLNKIISPLVVFEISSDIKHIIENIAYGSYANCYYVLCLNTNPLYYFRIIGLVFSSSFFQFHLIQTSSSFLIFLLKKRKTSTTRKIENTDKIFHQRVNTIP